MDFKKKHRLNEAPALPGQMPNMGAPGAMSEDNFQKEYKSSRDALAEFSPFRWRKQWTLIKNFTPEENETLETCLHELKTNMKYYTAIFLSASMAFNFWQRRFVPRKFYLFSFGVSCFAGTVFATAKTSWYYVEMMDKLGQEYELSRMMKQDIFDTRPDMNTAMRAQYYQHQQKMRDEQ